jgi:hypothetical protein
VGGDAQPARPGRYDRDTHQAPPAARIESHAAGASRTHSCSRIGAPPQATARLPTARIKSQTAGARRARSRVFATDRGASCHRCAGLTMRWRWTSLQARARQRRPSAGGGDGCCKRLDGELLRAAVEQRFEPRLASGSQGRRADGLGSSSRHHDQDVNHPVALAPLNTVWTV